MRDKELKNISSKTIIEELNFLKKQLLINEISEEKGFDIVCN